MKTAFLAFGPHEDVYVFDAENEDDAWEQLATLLSVDVALPALREDYTVRAATKHDFLVLQEWIAQLEDRLRKAGGGA